MLVGAAVLSIAGVWWKWGERRRMRGVQVQMVELRRLGVGRRGALMSMLQDGLRDVRREVQL